MVAVDRERPEASSPPLRGRLAVVTGGSRGIGRAVVGALAAAGADVLIVYRQSHEAAKALQDSMRSEGRSTDIACVDVRNPAAVTEALGDRAVDILVNSAGVNVDRTVSKLTLEDWNEVVDTNLTGTFLCIQAVLEGMRQRNFGRVVNIASIIGQMGNFGQANYAASKAGIIGLTKALALETARKDITVNAVCPGFIETDMLRTVPDDVAAGIRDRIPKQRFGQPDEVARLVVFLADPASGYLTGQQLNINGGMYL